MNDSDSQQINVLELARAHKEEKKARKAAEDAEKFLARTQQAKKDKQFKPQALSNTEGEERAYRRGFDQGMNAALRAIGLSSDAIRSLHYVQRGAEFREGLQKYPPWDATEKEKRDIAKALNTLIADANDTQTLG